MKQRLLILFLCAMLVLALAGCGGQAAPRPTPSAAPAAVQESAAPAPTEPPQSAEPAFPLLSAPLSELESEEMINHNALRCALLVENYYFRGELFADGSRALVRYEVIDNGLHKRTILLKDCAAEALCAVNGRLYYLGDGARVESISQSGADRRVETDAPCFNLQLFEGALYALRQDGALVCLDTGELLLENCYDAFLTTQGIFYVARPDARAHLFDPAAHTDVTLTAEAAEGLTILGTRLYYTTPGADGRHLCALDLMSGERFSQSAPFTGRADYITDEDGSWEVRLCGLYGEEQLLVACDGAFAEHVNARRLESGSIARCRGLDGFLRTDELLSPDGESLGFSLVTPEGRAITVLAKDNPAEK